MYLRPIIVALLTCTVVFELHSQVQLSSIHAHLADLQERPADRNCERPDPAPPQPQRVHSQPIYRTTIGDAGRPTDLVDIDASLLTAPHLARSARLVPAIRDGRPLGLKVYAVTPDSALAAMGVQNGDTLLTINGLSATDGRIIEHWAAGPPRAFDVELERKGERRRIVVLVHDTLVEADR